MGCTRLTVLLVSAAYLAAATVPCPRPADAASVSTQAAHGVSAPCPEHEVAGSVLTAPCPCGCGEGSAAPGGAAARLGPVLPGAGPPVPSAVAAAELPPLAQHAPAPPPLLPDPVPLVA